MCITLRRKHWTDSAASYAEIPKLLHAALKYKYCQFINQINLVTHNIEKQISKHNKAICSG